MSSKVNGTYKVCIEKCPDHFFTFLDMASDQETQAKIMVRIKSYTLETLSIRNIELRFETKFINRNKSFETTIWDWKQISLHFSFEWQTNCFQSHFTVFKLCVLFRVSVECFQCSYFVCICQWSTYLYVTNRNCFEFTVFIDGYDDVWSPDCRK